MKALPLIGTLLCLTLASCSRNPADMANPHDSKYSLINVGPDTCILDSTTQLIWQQKSAADGLNDAANTYSWFAPNAANGELDYRGLEDGGVCNGSACDIWHYVQAVNEARFCGHDDWRMPNKDEMYSISDLLRAKTPPTINTEFFPYTQTAEYWSANDYSFQWDAAWAWNFELGHDRVDWKKEAKYVRLVRGNAENLPEVKE